MAIKSGDPAPDFELRHTTGGTVRLSDFRGRRACRSVLDGKPGCTAEVCAFRDSHEDFARRRCESDRHQQRSAGRNRLAYRLLSEPDGAVRETACRCLRPNGATLSGETWDGGQG